MPRFTPNMNDVRATTPVYERGEYELEIAGVKGFYNAKEDGNDNFGVTVRFKMVGRVNRDGSVDDGLAGEDVAPMRAWLHSKGAAKMTKGFLMSAFGYGRNDEDAFNEEIGASHGFDIVPEDDDEPGEGEVGVENGWDAVVGNRVRCTLDKEEYEGNEQQRHKSFNPVNG